MAQLRSPPIHKILKNLYDAIHLQAKAGRFLASQLKNTVYYFMKTIIFIPHAEKRRRQRGYTTEEVAAIITWPTKKKVRDDGRIEIQGIYHNRNITVIYEEEKNYLRVITVI